MIANGIINPQYKEYIPPFLPDICGTAIYDNNGHIIGIEEVQQDLNQCIYADPNLSLTWVGASDFDYYDATDEYNKYKGIISLPLFLSNVNGYLSLYNTPCPDFVSTNTNGFITYDFVEGTNGFLDNKLAIPPPSGIPFRFDCKGNTIVNLQSTPCSLILNPSFPSSYWGLSPDCNSPSGITNPVVEQTASIIFIKPIQINGNNLRCNILTILQNNYSGWLTYANSNTIPGYTWGRGSIFSNKNILMWNQARFDPFNTEFIPGTTIDDLGPRAEFLLVQTGTPTAPTYTILAGSGLAVYTIGLDNIGANIGAMTNLKFTAATFDSQSIATSTSPTTVIIDGELLDDSLYSRGNRGTFDTPMCNLLISNE